MRNDEFQKIYEKAISYWPKSISVIDKEKLKNGGLRVPCLVHIHDEIEGKICLVKDSYALRQMDWAIYTVLHGMAKYSNTLKVIEIDIEKVRSVFYENMEDKI